MSLAGITLNGRPVEEYIDEETNREIKQVSKGETKRWHRPVVMKTLRNHSGARSGRVRIIYSARGAQ